MNIEEYGFERADLVVANAVNAYLKQLTPETRKETLTQIIRQDGTETVIEADQLATLIESAKAAAVIGSEEWKDGGDPLMKKTLDFIQEALPSVNSKEYVKALPREFLQFIKDLTME